MKTTTAIDITTGAVRDDVEAEKGYNHACDEDDLKEEYRYCPGDMAIPQSQFDYEHLQSHHAILEASMGDYMSDAETLVVESRPHPPTSRQRGQELLNILQIIIEKPYDLSWKDRDIAFDALEELSRMLVNK